VTPRLSIIAASIRRVIAAIGGAATASDYYWDNVVLAMKMNTGVDPEWANTVLAMHMDGTSFSDLKVHSISTSGSPTLSATQSKFGGKSALFNGTTDYLAIPTSTDFGFGTGDFTVECWVKTAASGTVLDLRSASGDLGLFAINGGFISLWNGSAHMQGSITVTTDAWVHLAWVRSAGVVSMFVNGVLDGVSATSATFGTTRPVRIGADISAANFFSGYIDDLRVSKVARYAVEFTPSAVPFLDGTAVPFLEEKGKAVTVVGNTSVNTTTKKYGTGSGYFDGTGDYLELADHADYAIGTGDFTIEMWFNMSAYPAAGTTYALASKYLGPLSRWLIYLGQSVTSDSGLKFVACNGSTAINSGSTDATVTLASLGVVINTWHHVAAVRKDGILYVYLNGAVLPKQTAINYDITYTGGTVQVGAQNALMPFNGYIDDLQITKGIAKYISNFTPTELATNKKTYLDPHWDKVVLGLHMDDVGLSDVKGHAVTLNGNTRSSVKSKFGGYSVAFDGTGGNYISFADSSDFEFGSGDFTIEFWSNTDATTKFAVAKRDTGIGADSWYVSVGGAPAAGFSADGTTWMATAYGPACVTSAWNHMAVVRSGATLTMFTNGLAGTPVTMTGSVNNSATAISVGASANGGFPINGYIDDLRITKGVARYTANFQPIQLPFPEKAYVPVPYVSDPHWASVVLAMHMDGSDNGTTFTEVKGKTVTRTGDVVTKTATKKFGTASAYFDGTGDYLTVPASADLTFTGDFTVEFWVMFPTLATSYFLGFGGTSYLLLTPVSALEVNMGGATITGAAALVAGQFYHMALSRVGSSMKLFVNGTPYGSAATTSASIGGSVLTVGTYTGGSPTLAMYIDDLRITKGVGRYVADFTPPGRFPEVLPN